jgi:hypothetical protein
MKFLTTLLMLCITLSVNAQQVQIVCLNAATNFNTGRNSDRGVIWNVRRTIDGVLENGAVATIATQSRTPITFGPSSFGSADAVNITFSKPGNYTITATCRRSSGWFNQNTSTTDVIFVVTVHLAQPEIQFVGIDGSQCLNPSVTLRVKETQRGVTYTWEPGGQVGNQISTNANSVTVTASSGVAAVGNIPPITGCLNAFPKGSVGFIPPVSGFGPGAFSIFGRLILALRTPMTVFSPSEAATSTFVRQSLGTYLVLL